MLVPAGAPELVLECCHVVDANGGAGAALDGTGVRRSECGLRERRSTRGAGSGASRDDRGGGEKAREGLLPIPAAAEVAERRGDNQARNDAGGGPDGRCAPGRR